MQGNPRARARRGLPGNAWRHAGNKSRRKGRQSVYQAVFAGRQDIRRDKYFRLLCEVKVNGADLGTALIEHGHAVPYDGGTKTL